MKLIFFDESKDEEEYPHYHIGGVCIDEASLDDVESEIADISRKAFGTAALSRETELHAADIYHRKRNFKHEPDFGKRLDLLLDFAHVLSRDDVRLIDIMINCEHLYGGQSPADFAFMFLCERADQLVTAERSRGMLIGDRENDDIAELYAEVLSGYRSSRTDFAFGRNIENLVDSVHFSHSHLSRFIQLADVYTWLNQFLNRNYKSKDKWHRAVLEIFEREDINLFPSKYKIWPKK